MGMVQIKIEAGEAGEMLGYVMVEEANKMIEEEEDKKLATKLHTVGRNLVEKSRQEQLADEKNENRFEDTLLKT